MRLMLFLSCLIGCGGGDGADGATADAAPPVDFPPPVPHQLFLQFEGQTLTPSSSDNALINATVDIDAVRTIPAFDVGAADRDTKIAAVVAAVTEILAPYNVDVVTARPAAGPYDMIVIGGTGTDVGEAAGVPAIFAPDCRAAVSSNVGLVFTQLNGSESLAVRIVGEFGSYHGVPLSNVVGDCMCIAESGNCSYPNTRCTIGGAGTTALGSDNCGVAANASFDEAALWLAKVGAHL